LSYHPEQPARIEACITALQEYQQQRPTETLSSETNCTLELIDVAETVSSGLENPSSIHHQPFSQQELDHARSILIKIHSPDLVGALEKRCRDSKQRRIEEGKDPLGFVGWIDEDTYVTTETYDVCLRATASWIRAVDWVNTQSLSCPSSAASLKRSIPTAMALTRPPGHHSTANQSNGFCIFNFAAAAAIHYLESSSSSSSPSSSSSSTDNISSSTRISILDYDVHFGQGVSDIVSKYPESIRYASIHQVPAFPYMGTKRGIRYNVLTIPIAADTTWGCGYHQYFQDALDFLFPQDNSWEPDLVIVCAGYDGLDSDELASVNLNAKDFGRMTRALQESIRRQKQQQQRSKPTRLMLGLEGGYQLRPMAGGGNLQQAVIETVQALLEV
jgi:acetoin utilization deacetylase AcuC-like enzyme